MTSRRIRMQHERLVNVVELIVTQVDTLQSGQLSECRRFNVRNGRERDVDGL